MNPQIIIRRIKEDDVKPTFEWANDPETRKNSFNQNEIKWEEHKAWFERRLIDPGSYFYIGELDGEPCGIVRFEYDEKEAGYIVSINIAPKFRGRGIATALLTGSDNLVKEDIGKSKLIAYVKLNNIGSKKAFCNSGYELVVEDDEKYMFVKNID